MNTRKTARAGALLILLLAFITVVAPQGAYAQEEGEPTVVDEVIAQVNNDVVTLSMLKREMAEAKEQLMKSRGMSEKDAAARIEGMRNEMIVGIINEQLLLQKGKDLNMTDDVETEVNKRLLEIGKEQNLKTVAELDAAMSASGLNPAEIRQTMRKEMMKNMVFNSEIDRKVFQSLKPDEVKKYYDANLDKFKKPESVDLSEIFLSLAGKPETEVRARAAQIVAQARGANSDFGALAVANSEREQDGARVAPQTKGKLGRVQISDISNKEVVAALKDLKTGAVTDPIKMDEGLLILRVDDRTPPGDAVFNETRVREVMTFERAEKEHETYLATLRDEAYIKVAKDYQSALDPLLAPKKLATPANTNAGAAATKGGSAYAPSKKASPQNGGKQQKP